MQPKKFSEYTPITETDGSEVIPILKAGVNATVKSEDLPISTATQTAIDAADADIAAHVADVANPHQVTKSQVGLGNADNTSDVNKPVSTAQATAIALKADQSTTYTKTEVDTKDTAVADTAQTNLTAHTSNTSNPHATTKAQVGLANADNTSDVDKPISAATQTALDAKATNTALDAHTTNTSNPHSVTKSQVGLGSVDNTSDINKPVSTAQAAALALKADVSALNSHTSNTLNPHSVTKAQVGLGNVDNTSDVNKPISTATQTALNAKANASGTVNLTGDQTIAGVKTFTSAPIAPSGTSIGGVLYLTGTGFPNGVVTAPTGSIYIDTAVTNGASSWIKKSGTGNTGWEVFEGDTGNRNINTLGDSATFTIGSLRVRRTGNMVELAIDIAAINTINAETNILTSTSLPAGFTPKNTIFTRAPFLVANSNSRLHMFRDAGVRILPTTGGFTTADGQWRVKVTYLTTDAWPTTLPGTAA